jgi:hypothetical protein
MFPAELGEGEVSGEGVYISPRGWWFSGVPQGNSGVRSGFYRKCWVTGVV